MSTPTFAKTHNLIAYLEKPTESKGFEQIIDFLNGSSVKYALTVNNEVRIQALVDGKRANIKESSIRRILRLDDVEGTSCLTNTKIFEGLARMGYEKPSDKLTFYKAFFSSQWKFLIHTILQCLSAKTTSWNEFSSTMASAVICLATNQKFNFSRYILLSLVKNIEAGVPFFMFLRVCTGFSWEVTSLFDNMLVQASEEVVDSDELVIEKEESSKQGRKIADIDADVEIILEKVQAEAYNLDLDHQEKVLSMLDVNVKEPAGVEEVLEVPKAAKLITEVVTTARVDVNDASVQDTPITVAEATKGVHATVDSDELVIEKEESSKQGRKIADTDADVEIILEKVQAKAYNLDLDHQEKVLSMLDVNVEEPAGVEEVLEVPKAAKLITEEVTRQLEAELNTDINWNAVIEQVKRSERLTDA
nr:hypothetical protein [Tanacetum cinerariifolium]